LCHALGDLGVTYTVHQWLVGKRVIDFLLVLIEFFRQVSRLRRYEQTLVETVLFERGWVTLSANFRGNEGWSTNKFWRQKTIPGLSRGVVCVILRLAIPACDTQTDIQTQTYDDGYYPRIASAVRLKNLSSRTFST